jgi:hypothetical protein
MRDGGRKTFRCGAVACEEGLVAGKQVTAHAGLHLQHDSRQWFQGLEHLAASAQRVRGLLELAIGTQRKQVDCEQHPEHRKHGKDGARQVGFEVHQVTGWLTAVQTTGSIAAATSASSRLAGSQARPKSARNNGRS